MFNIILIFILATNNFPEKAQIKKKTKTNIKSETICTVRDELYFGAPKEENAKISM
jgi:hypothetical protein